MIKAQFRIWTARKNHFQRIQCEQIRGNRTSLCLYNSYIHTTACVDAVFHVYNVCKWIECACKRISVAVSIRMLCVATSNVCVCVCYICFRCMDCLQPNETKRIGIVHTKEENTQQKRDSIFFFCWLPAHRVRLDPIGINNISPRFTLSVYSSLSHLRFYLFSQKEIKNKKILI